MIQQVTAFARDHEGEFIEPFTKSNAKSIEREIRKSKKGFKQAQAKNYLQLHRKSTYPQQRKNGIADGYDYADILQDYKSLIDLTILGFLIFISIRRLTVFFFYLRYPQILSEVVRHHLKI